MGGLLSLFDLFFMGYPFLVSFLKYFSSVFKEEGDVFVYTLWPRNNVFV